MAKEDDEEEVEDRPDSAEEGKPLVGAVEVQLGCVEIEGTGKPPSSWSALEILGIDDSLCVVEGRRTGRFLSREIP